MSNVQQKYNTTPSKNTKLGNLSLEENKTRFRDINDLFRQLMADIRQESNEARSLSSTASSKASTAQATAESVRGEINEITSVVNAIRSDVTASRQTAENAENAAEQAASNASQSASQAATAAATASAVQTVANKNQTDIASLKNRVSTLESAAAAGSGVALVDGTTIEYQNGDMTAVDIAVDGDLEDLATARGQIGRSGIASDADLNTLTADGWYAVGGEKAGGLPEGVVAGVCRVSSGYAESSHVQCLFTPGEGSCRAFVRSTVNGGTTWTNWQEQIFASSLGEGLVSENGVVSADFSEVLPEAPEGGEDLVLSAGGAWVERITPEQLTAVSDAVDELAQSIADFNTALEAVQATVAAEPDGTTIAIVDGQYSVPLYLGATEEEDGIAGLVPPAEAAATGLFLRSDGTWADPAMETYTFDGSSAGLVPIPEESGAEEETRYLKADGTWEDPCEGLTARVAAIEEWDWEALSNRVGELEAFATSAQIDALWGIETPETPEEPEPEEPEEPGGEGGE